MEYLTLVELMNLAERLGTAEVRDYGLLESALARPRASVFGQDAYPDIWQKAAALMESIARNH
ncbi:MAG: death-on-curing protein, partial [Nocardia sp.]|nr:death-on-curing protein [Nocardia sp.]